MTGLAFGLGARLGLGAAFDALDTLDSDEPKASYLDAIKVAPIAEFPHPVVIVAERLCSLASSHITRYAHKLNCSVKDCNYLGNMPIKIAIHSNSWYNPKRLGCGSGIATNKAQHHTTPDSDALTGYRILDKCNRLGRFAFTVED